MLGQAWTRVLLLAGIELQVSECCGVALSVRCWSSIPIEAVASLLRIKRTIQLLIFLVASLDRACVLPLPFVEVPSSVRVYSFSILFLNASPDEVESGDQADGLLCVVLCSIQLILNTQNGRQDVF